MDCHELVIVLCQAAAMGLEIPVRNFDDTDALDSRSLTHRERSALQALVYIQYHALFANRLQRSRLSRATCDAGFWGLAALLGDSAHPMQCQLLRQICLLATCECTEHHSC